MYFNKSNPLLVLTYIKIVNMEGIPFTFFKLFGIHPFKILPNNQIKVSYFWSIISVSILIPFSFWRIHAYTVLGLNYKNGLFHDILTMLDPCMLFFRISFIYFLVLQPKSLNKIKAIVKTLHELSSVKSKIAQIRMFIFTMVPFSYLVHITTNYLFRDNEMSVKIDMIVMLLQDTLLLSVLIQLCIFANITLLSLEKVEKGLTSMDCRINHELLFKIVSVDLKMRKTYNSLVSVVMLECWYNALFGLKFTQDILFSENVSHDPALIFGCIYQIPFLFLLMHFGDEYEGKVFKVIESFLKVIYLSFAFFIDSQISRVLDLLDKMQDIQENPDITSLLYRLRFTEGLYQKFNHKTIFRFCYQLMTFYVITLQFSDVLNEK